MVGEHIHELKARAHSMTPEHIEESRKAWINASNALLSVGRRLEKAAPRLLAGFGDSDIGNTARDTFQSAGAKILTRQEDLHAAAQTLEPVYAAAYDAKAAAGQSVQDPGERPTPTDPIGTGMSPAEAMTHDAKQMRAYNQRVASFGAADDEARLKLQALDRSYDDAAAVLARIHGDPDVPGPGSRDDSAGGSGDGNVPVSGTGAPYGHVPLVGSGGPHPVTHVPGHTTGTPPLIEPVEPGYQPTPGHEPDGSAASGSGSVASIADAEDDGRSGGVGPAVIGGATAAGAFAAAPGLVKGIRGLVGSRLPTSGTGAIGASARTGGPGSLGRPGNAGTPGSQTNRGAGRPGGRSGSRAGGRDATGTASGRGTGGSGAAAGAQRGGRKRDEEGRDERDLFDDGQEWLDDEGTGPGVLS